MIAPPNRSEVVGAAVEWPADYRPSSGVITEFQASTLIPRLLDVSITYTDGRIETRLLEFALPYLVSTKLANRVRPFFEQFKRGVGPHLQPASEKAYYANPEPSPGKPSDALSRGLDRIFSSVSQSES